jgi:hypothetical protein
MQVILSHPHFFLVLICRILIDSINHFSVKLRLLIQSVHDFFLTLFCLNLLNLAVNLIAETSCIHKAWTTLVEDNFIK